MASGFYSIPEVFRCAIVAASWINQCVSGEYLSDFLSAGILILLKIEKYH
jgi:hypothetical protein